MNMYAHHLKESYDRFYKENEFGFITWQYKSDTCIINTLYIKPEYRATGLGSSLANDVTEEAKKRECKKLMCEIDTRSKTYIEAYTAITKYGFKPLDLYGTYLILSKEI